MRAHNFEFNGCYRVCKMCGGSGISGTLTSHCSLEKLPEHYKVAVMLGDLDFINGKWEPSSIRAKLDRENK